MSFTFDEEKHEYRLNGEVIPSVTQILKPLYDFSAVPAGVLERSAAFGTAVHKTVELYLKNDLDEETLDEGLKGPLEAFKQWEESEYGKHFFNTGSPIVEEPIYHPRLKYAGTPDLVFPYDDVDLKSRPFNPLVDPLQLVAYSEANIALKFKDQRNSVRNRYVLELRQDGTYCFTKCSTSQSYWSRFRFLLDYYKAGQQIKLWRDK